jgi:hypothetical protein
VVKGSTHWNVDYNIDTIVSSTAFANANHGGDLEKFRDEIDRYVTGNSLSERCVSYNALHS